jgi:hypothetical protein
VTSGTYLINAALLKGHSLAGVTLCAKNHVGSVYRENTGPRDQYKGWNPDTMHGAITARTRPMVRNSCRNGCVLPQLVWGESHFAGNQEPHLATFSGARNCCT